VIRIAAVGIASTGKSSVLNAVFGTSFPVDVRARTTTRVLEAVEDFEGTTLHITDTPPLGEAMSQTHVDADVFLLVCDKDLTAVEHAEVARIARLERPVAIVLNKSDMFSGTQRDQLLNLLERRTSQWVPVRRVVSCAASPIRIVHSPDANGILTEHTIHPEPDISELLMVIRRMIAEAGQSPRVLAREFSAAALRRGAEAARRAGKELSRAWRRGKAHLTHYR
jgi:tRNA U34 5-carboxymethylaminomethyl modifying GTPase MnmE/TrmE